MPTPKIYQVANLQTQLTTTSDSANNRVLKAGDTMMGQLNISAGGLLVTGNVGLGVASPGLALDVNGAVRASSGTTNGLRVHTNSGITASGNYMNFFTGQTNGWAFNADGVGADTNTRIVITSAGNLGIGTTGPGTRLHVSGNSGDLVTVSGAAKSIYLNCDSGGGGIFTGPSQTRTAVYLHDTNDYVAFFTTATERARITSGGDFLVGTTTTVTNVKFVVGGSISCQSTNGVIYFGSAGTPAGQANYGVNAAIGRSGGTNFHIGGSVEGDMCIAPEGTKSILFGTSGSANSCTERARITAGGDLLVGTTNTDPVVGNVVGGGISAAGIIRGSATSSPSLGLNRRVDDGDLVHFYQAGTFEGSISVSGATVSYNAFAGSHWSQLQDGSKPDILRGTVMESINELCVWLGEENERLPKSKVSDTAGSKKVYGVFMAWDNDWTETNDMYVTAVGAFICRVNGGVTVEEGDLLESNGDGTARVQADDIIRSSTIGKVTSTVKTHQYDDGSYCVPTVLYCG